MNHDERHPYIVKLNPRRSWRPTTQPIAFLTIAADPDDAYRNALDRFTPDRIADTPPRPWRPGLVWWERSD